MANVNMMIEPRFSAEAFGAKTAGALNALLAQEGCVSADTLRDGVVATESVPFTRPTDILMYEADALTWCFYHIHSNIVAHAINDTAYGDALARGSLSGQRRGRTFGRRRSTKCARPSRRCGAHCALFCRCKEIRPSPKPSAHFIHIIAQRARDLPPSL
jgi:hypothetical protein